MAKKRKRTAPSEPKRPRLVALRKKAGLTQEELAEKCDVEKTSVSHWEQGTSFPKRTRQPMVASALGVTVTQLLEAAVIVGEAA